MHIAEGFLPVRDAAAWTLVAAPFVAHGARRLARIATQSPAAGLTLGAAGGFTLLLSSLKLPSLAGSSSHPTGVALGAVICGPSTMAAIGCPVLLVQALLLAHGGLTTLGANTVSMAVVGPWVSWAVWRTLGRLGVGDASLFVATALGALATYMTTALQLALAFPDASGGISGAFLKFAGVFLLPQLPLAVAEGWFTVAAYHVLRGRQLDSLVTGHA